MQLIFSNILYLFGKAVAVGVLIELLRHLHTMIKDKCPIEL